jgi:hypothetical protein
MMPGPAKVPRAWTAVGCFAVALFMYAGCRDREGAALPKGGAPPVVVAEPPPPTALATAAPAAPAPAGTATPTAMATAGTAVSSPGLLRRPWVSLTRADLEQAVRQAGHQVGQFSESDASNGRLLRILKVSKGSFQGSVGWYKTDDVEGARSSFVQGAPHRVEGGVLLVVKTADPAGRAEAESLLEALAGR